jgi:hypothetical protein
MMRTTIERKSIGGISLWLAVVVAAGWCGVADADERTPSQLLEKGIYTEETVGDLDKAIEIYQQAIDSAQANRTILAQAQLRLGLCFLKQGQEVKGTEALQKLIDEFPDQKEMVAQARKHLPDAPQPLQLGPVPWADGEVLRMDLTLPVGRFMGIVFTTADKMTVDGRNIWRVGLRRFIASRIDNQGASRVDADAETFLPINSSFKHTVLGDSEAEYGKDRVRVVSHPDGSEKVRTVDFDGATYDDEQAWFLMRRMPLAVGYKTTMPVISIVAGTKNSAGVEVTAIETVSVPVGTFECYKVEIDLQQAVYWISTDANRYLVKFEAGGIGAELADIGTRNPTETIAYQDLGFSLTVPPGWYHRRNVGAVHDPKSQQVQVTVLLLDPNGDLRSGTVEVYSTKDDWTLASVAERELEGVKRRFKDYTLRGESWQERRISGSPAISFVGDYKESDKDYVQYRVYMVNDKKIEFIFKVAADRFDELLPTLDSIVSSFRTE